MKKVTLFIIVLLFFIILHLTLYINHCSAQWYQITLPVSGQVWQMQFIKSNTGWATIKQSSTNYTLLKSTNGGVNWFSIFSDSAKVQKFQFINDTLGYALGQSSYIRLLQKTTNGGYNWTVLQSSGAYFFGSFYFVNADSGWVDAVLTGPPDYVYIFKTANGFQTLENIYTRTNTFIGDEKLLFINEPQNGQYFGYHLNYGNLWKTTNSGYNWQQINIGSTGNVNSFSFINKDTGWVVFNPYIGNGTIYKTINNGANWVQQYNDNSQYNLGIISAMNNNKIFCGTASNYILATSNEGVIWGKQSCQIPTFYLYIVDTSLGFAWNASQIQRTTNGGGPITKIIYNNEQITNLYKLYQNYPNPFNAETEIEFTIKKSSIINLTIYDILGRELVRLISSQEMPQGSFKYTLNLSNFNLSSGIYIYKMNAMEKQENKIFSSVKKMLYIK